MVSALLFDKFHGNRTLSGKWSVRLLKKSINLFICFHFLHSSSIWKWKIITFSVRVEASICVYMSYRAADRVHNFNFNFICCCFSFFVFSLVCSSWHCIRVWILICESECVEFAGFFFFVFSVNIRHFCYSQKGIRGLLLGFIIPGSLWAGDSVLFSVRDPCYSTFIQKKNASMSKWMTSARSTNNQAAAAATTSKEFVSFASHSSNKIKFHFERNR